MVMIDLAGMDTDKGKNIRLLVKAIHISNKSFVIEYKTWQDSIIYAVYSNYIIIS